MNAPLPWKSRPLHFGICLRRREGVVHHIRASYQPWDWILSTGVYVDDIDAAFRSTLYQSRGILAVSRDSDIASSANQIASNDLTGVVKTARDDRSSLLFSMKRMQHQLTQTIGTIKISADSIATATHQIAAGNQGLSQRTEEQAASLEESAASMAQLTSTVSLNAENARQAPNSLRRPLRWRSRGV